MDKAKSIVNALGGVDNILDIEPCITRLRTEVRDPSRVDEAALKAAGAHGVLRSAPIAGTLVKLHPHAFVVVGDGGQGVLVHLGIDTVQLQGEGFELLAEEGTRVRAGQPLIRWDPAAVAASGRSPICPVVALDAPKDALTELREDGPVAIGDRLFVWS